MSEQARRRVTSWSLFFFGVAFIIATLELAFEASSFLRSRGYLWHTIKLLFGLSSLLFAYLLPVGAGIRSPWIYLRATPAIAAFAYAVPALRDSPAERFHFIEYGVLSLLALRAIAVDVRGYLAYPLAWLLASAAGYLDESIQGMSSYRFFDWKDVEMNGYAAALATLVYLSLFGREPSRARFDHLSVRA